MGGTGSLYRDVVGPEVGMVPTPGEKWNVCETGEVRQGKGRIDGTTEERESLWT